MDHCKGCPAHGQVLLARAMGAEDCARELESEGCSWWQPLPVDSPGGSDVVMGCLRRNLRQYAQRYGQDILLASDTVQKDRTEQEHALNRLDAAIAQRGLDQVARDLSGLGLRAAIGAWVTEAERQRDADRMLKDSSATVSLPEEAQS